MICLGQVMEILGKSCKLIFCSFVGLITVPSNQKIKESNRNTTCFQQKSEQNKPNIDYMAVGTVMEVLTKRTLTIFQESCTEASSLALLSPINTVSLVVLVT
jgi:hypothetical protein